MSSSPEFISVEPGNSGNVTVYITSIDNFNAAVALTVGSPPAIQCSLSPSSVTPSASQTSSASLSITVQEWVAQDMYHITVEGVCTDPSITKYVDITLDVPPLAQWGPSIYLSQTYGSAGDTITITGSNFPPQLDGETVIAKEVFTDTTLTTIPSPITLANGRFTATFTVPSGIPSGNYRIETRVPSDGAFAEQDFQIMAAGSTFTLGVTPASVTVATEEGGNSASASVNLFSVAGSTPTVNLDVEGAPFWLQYQFGSLAANTPVSGENAVSVPAGGSSTRSLTLTVSMTAPPGNYSITVKAWETGQTAQLVSLDLTVQPPAGFNMAQFTLSPTYGAAGKKVSFSGSGFTGCTPGQVTELTFGSVNLTATQSLPTITVPQDGDSAGKFSGTFTVPSLPAGTYPVDIRVGTPPNDKFSGKPFTITGTSGALEHSTEVMVICTPSGATVTPYSSPYLDPTTITTSTPVDMEPPWGDKITINNLITDVSEAGTITPAKVDVAPETVGTLPTGASDMLGRITNIDSSTPVAGVDWQLGFPYNTDNLTAAGLEEENLKVAYLNPTTGT